MKYVIQAVGFANGEDCPHAGQYLLTYDPDAYYGIGFADFTSDIGAAMTFPSAHEAVKLWRTQSTACPMRGDGKPNRPLTALTITIKRKR